MIVINGQENIKYLLDSIEDLVISSPKIPIFNKLLLDEDKLFSMLDTLRQNLPKELNEANEIVNNRNKILSEAEERAKAMINAAEERARLLIGNHEVLKKANFEAQKIKYEASKELEKNQEEADKYADSVLENMENKVSNLLNIVKNGRESLVQNLK